MTYITDPPDDMMIPDVLRGTHDAVSASARTIVPRRAFLDSLDARMQQEAGRIALAVPSITTHVTDEGADWDGPILAPMPGRDTAGAMANRSVRAISRRRFLIG